MFSELEKEIFEFATERNWGHFHHPKNVILNLFVETAELAEQLIGLADPSFEDLTQEQKRFKEISDELGDIMINLTTFASHTNIELKDYQAARLSSQLSPSQVVHRLSATLNFLAEPLIWISEQQSKEFEAPDHLKNVLREAVSIVLFFAERMKIEPFQAAKSKLEKIKQKYPTGTNRKDMNLKHINKIINRNSYDQI